MAIYCFDGTSEHGKGHHGGTNVLRLAEQMADQHFYFGGVGNSIETDGLGRIIGLAFGFGGQDILNDAMEQLKQTLDADPIVDMIGFSRGSAIGIEFIHRAKEWAAETGKPITFRFIAIMDTVFSFGLPNDIDLHYHHALPTDVPIQAVYHAVAMNETRSWFPVTCQPELPNVQDFKEVGFSGAHADIGGGYKDRSLSNIVLNWLIEGALANGVAFKDSLPTPEPYPSEVQAVLPGTQEYFMTAHKRLPFRECQWFFPQAPRKIDRHVVEEAASRGIYLCDWQLRTVEDYRTKPRPKVKTYYINLSPYMTQNGRVINPAKDYKLYNKKRGNGRPMLIATHKKLTQDEQINFGEQPTLNLPRKPRRRKFGRR